MTDLYLPKKIASEGYISYLDPETGDVEVSNPRDKDVEPQQNIVLQMTWNKQQWI